MEKYTYGIYAVQPLYFVKLKLSKKKKYELIEYLEGDAYFNTAQETEEYAFEFLIVVRNICHNHLVLNPIFLLIEDCFDDLKSILGTQWNVYYKEYQKLINDSEWRNLL